MTVCSSTCLVQSPRAPPRQDKMSAPGQAFAEAVKLGEAASTKDEAVQAALECPCIEGLKSSSCGTGFVEALSCFMRADETERGAKCAGEFVALHACMVTHAGEFTEFTNELIENEKKEGYAKAASGAA